MSSQLIRGELWRAEGYGGGGRLVDMGWLVVFLIVFFDCDSFSGSVRIGMNVHFAVWHR